MQYVINKNASGQCLKSRYVFLFQIFLLVFSFKSIKCDGTDSKVDKTLLTNLEKLRLQLFTNYDKNVQPYHHNVPSNISLGMTVTYIDIDELNGRVTMHSWLRMRWMDDNRSWNASEYDNITQMHLKPDEVWRPSIYLFNSAGENNYIGDTQLILFSEGSFLWVPPSLYTAYCSLNFAVWPYDVQTCKFRIGSLSVTQIDANSIKDKDNLDYSDLVQSTEWAIKHASMEYESQSYYNLIEFSFVLERRSTMYAAVIFTPASCVVLLALASFWLPPHMGEKIMLNGITAVIIAAFLMYFANLLPVLSNNVPLVVLFYSWSLLLVTISTAISVIVLYLSTSKHKRRVPDFIKKLLNGRLGSILLLANFTLEAEPPLYEDPDSATDTFGINPNTLPSNRAIQFDWILLANAVDRICFVFYCLVFISLAILFAV